LSENNKADQASRRPFLTQPKGTHRHDSDPHLRSDKNYTGYIQQNPTNYRNDKFI